ncbi:Ubiquitin C-terminal hydrolase [Pelomyxa schiedti]|nr:Ubiquitin C-terminal hydrolase [Pelomyxa schiedti]
MTTIVSVAAKDSTGTKCFSHKNPGPQTSTREGYGIRAGKQHNRRTTVLAPKRKGLLCYPECFFSKSTSKDHQDSNWIPEGFKNLGNTCYLSAALQCLSSLPCFTHDLLSAHLFEIVETATETQIQREKIYGFYEAFYELFQKKAREGHQVLNPQPLKESLSKHVPEFSGYNQQDAHEFLSFCFDALEAEISSYLQPAKRNSTESLMLCPIELNFSCELENLFTCSQCQYTSSKKELYRILSLEAPSPMSPEPASLQTLLHNFLKEEHIEKDCTECPCLRADVQHKFCALPRVLVLHLNRFLQGANGKISKNTSPVSVPLVINIGNPNELVSEGVTPPFPISATTSTRSPPGAPPVGPAPKRPRVTSTSGQCGNITVDSIPTSPSTTTNAPPPPTTTATATTSTSTSTSASTATTSTSSTTTSARTTTTAHSASSNETPTPSPSPPSSSASSSSTTAHARSRRYHNPHGHSPHPAAPPPSSSLHRGGALPSPHSYSLASIIQHNGASTSTGHYIAIVRGPVNTNRWSVHNDALGRSITEQEALDDEVTRNGYLFFYLASSFTNTEG